MLYSHRYREVPEVPDRLTGTLLDISLRWSLRICEDYEPLSSIRDLAKAGGLPAPKPMLALVLWGSAQ